MRAMRRYAANVDATADRLNHLDDEWQEAMKLVIKICNEPGASCGKQTDIRSFS
jgi:hypothetical protein